MNVSENKAKLNLEKQANIEFDYYEATYDKYKKQYRFTIKMPSQKIEQRFRNLNDNNIDSNTLIVSEPDDFEPYKTLADYLEIPFFDVFDYIFFDYGNDIQIGAGQNENIYCWTGDGWLKITDIEKAFFSRFTKQRKNNSLESEEWIVKIYKNCCRGITYRKSKKGQWPTAYECRLTFDVLQDKLIRLHSKGKFTKKSLIKTISKGLIINTKATIGQTSYEACGTTALPVLSLSEMNIEQERILNLQKEAAELAQEIENKKNAVGLLRIEKLSLEIENQKAMSVLPKIVSSDMNADLPQYKIIQENLFRKYVNNIKLLYLKKKKIFNITILLFIILIVSIVFFTKLFHTRNEQNANKTIELVEPEIIIKD